MESVPAPNTTSNPPVDNWCRTAVHDCAELDGLLLVADVMVLRFATEVGWARPLFHGNVGCGFGASLGVLGLHQHPAMMSAGGGLLDAQCVLSAILLTELHVLLAGFNLQT